MSSFNDSGDLVEGWIYICKKEDSSQAKKQYAKLGRSTRSFRLYKSNKKGGDEYSKEITMAKVRTDDSRANIMERKKYRIELKKTDKKGGYFIFTDSLEDSTSWAGAFRSVDADADIKTGYVPRNPVPQKVLRSSSNDTNDKHSKPSLVVSGSRRSLGVSERQSIQHKQETSHMAVNEEPKISKSAETTETRRHSTTKTETPVEQKQPTPRPVMEASASRQAPEDKAGPTGVTQVEQPKAKAEESASKETQGHTQAAAEDSKNNKDTIIDLADNVKLQEELKSKLPVKRTKEEVEVEDELSQLSSILASKQKDEVILMYHISRMYPKKMRFTTTELLIQTPLYECDSIIIICYGGTMPTEVGDNNVLLFAWHGNKTSITKKASAAIWMNLIAERISGVSRKTKADGLNSGNDAQTKAGKGNTTNGQNTNTRTLRFDGGKGNRVYQSTEEEEEESDIFISSLGPIVYKNSSYLDDYSESTLNRENPSSFMSNINLNTLPGAPGRQTSGGYQGDGQIGQGGFDTTEKLCLFQILKGKVFMDKVEIPPIDFGVYNNKGGSLGGNNQLNVVRSHKREAKPTGVFVIEDDKTNTMYQYFPISLPELDNKTNLHPSLYASPYSSNDITTLYKLTAAKVFKSVKRIYVYNIVKAIYKLWTSSSACRQMPANKRDVDNAQTIPNLIEYFLGLVSDKTSEKPDGWEEVKDFLIEDLTTLLVFYSKVSCCKYGGAFIPLDANCKTVTYNSAQGREGAESWSTCVLPTYPVDYSLLLQKVAEEGDVILTEESEEQTRGAGSEKKKQRIQEYFKKDPRLDVFFKNRLNVLVNQDLSLFEFKIRIVNGRQEMKPIRIDEVSIMTALGNKYYRSLIQNEITIMKCKKILKQQLLGDTGDSEIGIKDEEFKAILQNTRQLSNNELLDEIGMGNDQFIQIPIDYTFLKSNSVFILIKTDEKTGADMFYVWVGKSCTPLLSFFCMKYIDKKRRKGEQVTRVDEYNEPIEFLSLLKVMRGEKDSTLGKGGSRALDSRYEEYYSFILNYNMRDKSKSILYNSVCKYNPLNLYLLPDFGKLIAQRAKMSVSDVVRTLFPTRFSYPRSMKVYEIVDDKPVAKASGSDYLESDVGVFHSTSTYLAIMKRAEVLEREILVRTLFGIPCPDPASLPQFLIFIWRGEHSSSLGAVCCYYDLLPQIKKIIDVVVKKTGTTSAASITEGGPISTLTPEQYRKVPPYVILNETEYEESLMFQLVFNNRIHVLSGPSKRMISKIPGPYIQDATSMKAFASSQNASLVLDAVKQGREMFFDRKEKKNVRMFKFTVGLIGNTIADTNTPKQGAKEQSSFIVQPCSVLPTSVCCELPVASFGMLDTRGIFVITEKGLSRMRVWVGQHSGYLSQNESGLYIRTMVTNMCSKLASEVGSGDPQIVVEKETLESLEFERLIGSKSEYTRVRDVRIIPTAISQPQEKDSDSTAQGGKKTGDSQSTTSFPRSEDIEYGNLANSLDTGTPSNPNESFERDTIPTLGLIPGAPFAPRFLVAAHSGNDGIVVRHIFPSSELLFSDLDHLTSSYIVDFGTDIYVVNGLKASPALLEAVQQMAKRYLKVAREIDGRSESFKVRKSTSAFRKHIHSQAFASWTETKVVPSPDAFAPVNERLVRFGFEDFMERERKRRRERAEQELGEAEYTTKLIETFGEDLIKGLLENNDKVDACMMGEHIEAKE